MFSLIFGSRANASSHNRTPEGRPEGIKGSKFWRQRLTRKGSRPLERVFQAPKTYFQGVERVFRVPKTYSQGVERVFQVPKTYSQGVERVFQVPKTYSQGV